MKRLSVIFGSVVILGGCTAPTEEGLIIAGKVNFPEQGLVLLEEFENKQTVVIDTVEVQSDGSFEHQVSIDEPGFYRLNFYNKQMANMLLDGHDLQVEADGNAPRGHVKVTGSPAMQHINEVQALTQEFQQQVTQLNSQFSQAGTANDQQQMAELRAEYQNLNQRYKAQIKDKIRQMGNSLAVLQVVGALDAEEDFALLDSLGNVFAANPPDSKNTPDFLKYIDQVRAQNSKMAKVQIGKQAPEIELPNPDGKLVTLSSLRGKVVLVDFWAQWCKPCRMENPNIVAAYQEYKDRGFEVFGVSLDRNREQWLRGIEEDGLDWTQVSDLKYWQSEAAQTYGVNAIPASFLLDREGKIIARNLRGPALHAKLKEVLG